jgi:hypothetical protein
MMSLRQYAEDFRSSIETSIMQTVNISVLELFLATEPEFEADRGLQTFDARPLAVLRGFSGDKQFHFTWLAVSAYIGVPYADEILNALCTRCGRVKAALAVQEAGVEAGAPEMDGVCSPPALSSLLYRLPKAVHKFAISSADAGEKSVVFARLKRSHRAGHA